MYTDYRLLNISGPAYIGKSKITERIFGHFPPETFRSSLTVLKSNCEPSFSNQSILMNDIRKCENDGKILLSNSHAEDLMAVVQGSDIKSFKIHLECTFETIIKHTGIFGLSDEVYLDLKKEFDKLTEKVRANKNFFNTIIFVDDMAVEDIAEIIANKFKDA